MSRRPVPVLLAAVLCGCPLARGVKLGYSPAKSTQRAEHKTALVVSPFLDRREDPGRIGRATTALPGVTQPLSPTGDVAAWATKAAVAELAASGYVVTSSAPVTVGGTVRAIDCSGGKRVVCSVKIEMWTRLKHEWDVSKREYTGEGAMPPVFYNEDLYALSLEEALRDVLGRYRRDLELMAP
ncbi:MAG: hypothetical protein HY078_12350 [Elusimicrobia bacterium]|nr:hypothetical protein [Elusimicrobiota bacterium]